MFKRKRKPVLEAMEAVLQDKYTLEDLLDTILAELEIEVEWEDEDD